MDSGRRVIPTISAEIREGFDGRSGLRASARAFVLFAARGRAARSRAWPSSPRPTGSRRSRSPTPTTCSVRSNSPRSWPAPASSRSSAARWRSISATRRATRGQGRAAAERPRIVLLAARENGYRSLMRLNSRAFLETPPNEPPHVKLAWLEGETDGLIALTGGPGGPLDAAIVAGQGALAASRCEALQRLFGDRLYVELQRHGTEAERIAEAALVELAYAQGIPLVATNEPLLRHPRRPRGPRRADLHRRGPAGRRHRAAQAHARAPLQDPRRDGRAVRRPAGGARLHGRDRAALRLPAADPGADPAALLGRRAGTPVDEAAELRRQAEAGLERRLAVHGLAPGRTPRTTARGSTSSSASSRR